MRHNCPCFQQLWLIRHGESESNAGLPVEYPGGTGLTPRGEREAQAVAATVATAPDLIVVSPYRRTALTAIPLQERFPATPVTEWPVQEFTPISIAPGTLTTLAERHPMMERYWDHDDPAYRDGPHAETFVDLLERAAWLHTTLLARPEPFIVLFSHATFLRAFVWSLWRAAQEPRRGDVRRFHHFLNGLPFPNGAILPVLITDQQVWPGALQTDHLHTP